MAATTAAVVGAVAAVGGVVEGKKSAKKAQQAQEAQNAQNRQFIQQQAAEARKDVLPLFDAAQQARVAGARGALDVFGETIPQQAELFQRGNVEAQQALLAGLPQMQQAILGLPTDLSQLQPTELDFNVDFSSVPLPESQTVESILGPPKPEPRQTTPIEDLKTERLQEMLRSLSASRPLPVSSSGMGSVASAVRQGVINTQLTSVRNELMRREQAAKQPQPVVPLQGVESATAPRARPASGPVGGLLGSGLNSFNTSSRF